MATRQGLSARPLYGPSGVAWRNCANAPEHWHSHDIDLQSDDFARDPKEQLDPRWALRHLLQSYAFAKDL